MTNEIDRDRLANDLDYWNRVVPDDQATHYCTISDGFEYLDASDVCDIPKPGTSANKPQIYDIANLPDWGSSVG